MTRSAFIVGYHGVIRPAAASTIGPNQSRSCLKIFPTKEELEIMDIRDLSYHGLSGYRR
jgi:hypothetical protein